MTFDTSKVKAVTILIAMVVAAASLDAATLYVSLTGSNIPPFATWASAATNIQNAVDETLTGDMVVVTNGTYPTGARIVDGLMANRVVVNKPITLLSVNGPLFTVIEGKKAFGSLGDDAIRCIYLTNGASLSGFTLTNGATRIAGDLDREQSGGGIWCASSNVMVTNCIVVNNSAFLGGGVYSGTLLNCTITNNGANVGGGVLYANLSNCTLVANSAGNGGAAHSSVLNWCMLITNSASGGGGAHSSTLVGCIVVGNSGGDGAGTVDSTLNNCMLTGNVARNEGGGVYGGRLSDCTLRGNFATRGGATYSATVSNCILLANVATNSGGAAFGGSLTYCTLSGNSAVNGGGAFSSGGNFAFLDSCTLQSNSASSVGGGVYGAYLVNCTLNENSAQLGGGAYQASLSTCIIASNNAVTSGGGAYNCSLYSCGLSNNWAYDGGGTYLGSLNSCNLMNNGATNRGGGASGGDLTACTLVSNTAYDGGGSCSANVTDCVIVSNSASWGGGASLGVLTRCTLKFNSAYDGGGSDSSTLLSCLLLGNSAYLDGGGTDDGFLLGCTIVQNSAGRYGGGVSFSTLRNCIVLQNLAPVGANYAPGNAPLDLNYCCTQPLPTNGVGNINSDPLFLNATAGNFRLQSNSSCINFGNDSYTPSQTKDLDGRPRVVGRVLDIGAYEFDPRVSGYFLAWLQQYGLPTDGSADYADPDHDGVNNWQEWLAGTNPTNSASVELPRMLSAIPVGTNNVTVTWSSMLGASYTLQFATNITMPLTFLTVATNIAGQSNITTFTHTNPSASGQAFYRVGLQ